MPSIEVLFTPAEFRKLKGRDLTDSICVVFDVLRATSTMVVALANGAKGIIPVEEIPEAIALKRKRPELLLAGERNGLQIGAALTGGIEFDLGNSPREFTADKVKGATIVSTTTNGTRALRACAHAKQVLAGSFLNLTVTAEYVARTAPTQVLIVCAGTGENSAYEDTVAAGTFCEALKGFQRTASAETACQVIALARDDVATAIARESDNARRLLAIQELRDDVEFCLRQDRFPIVAALGADGVVVRIN